MIYYTIAQPTVQNTLKKKKQLFERRLELRINSDDAQQKKVFGYVCKSCGQ